jgi:hypothetical protein
VSIERPLVIVIGIALLAGCGARNASMRDPATTRRYEEERAGLVATLRALYTPERPITEEEWAHLETELARFPLHESDVQMCQWIRSALLDDLEDDLDVQPIGGGPCLGWIPENPFRAPDADAPRPSRVEPLEEGVVALRVGTLHPDTPPLSDDDLAALAAAEAVLVDLREAPGDDVTSIWPAVEAIIGRGPIRPVGEVTSRTGPEVEAARERASLALGAHAAFDAASFEAAHGDGSTPLPTPERPNDGTARVVVGLVAVCGRGCDLIARTLSHYVGPVYAPTRFTGVGLATRADPGVYELRSVGVRVTFPTTRIAVDVPRVLFRRHTADPPAPCADLPPTPLGEETPIGISSDERHRMEGEVREHYLLELELPPNAADAFVRGCPGIVIDRGPTGPEPSLQPSGSAERRWGSRFEVWGTTHDLSRLLGSPVLIQLRHEIDAPVHID